MYIFKLKNLLFVFITLVLGAAIAIALVSPQKVEVLANVKSNIIVVDAGHGAPDGGASANGITESDLNLVIAKKLESALIDNGFDVIMTREDADNIADADDQRSITEMKRSDLNNRVEIINESGADLCISIHLNKYDSPKYWGWQTFFNENSEEGKRLADNIQKSIGEFVNRENSRQALKISGIKIVDKTNIPVVIVECGFISNKEEAILLQNDEYQDKLVSRNLQGC